MSSSPDGGGGLAPYINFDRAAGFYEETRFIPPERLAEAAGIVVRDLGSRADSPFLDAGVGTGRFARALAAAGLNVVGLDISSEMLRKAREIGPKLQVARADLRAMPVASAHFGGCMMVHILHLISDWHKVILEARRALAPGAALYFGTESGKSYPTRALYFKLADERGFHRPSIGAASFAAILEHVANGGADVEQIDQGLIRWDATMQVSAILKMMRRNPFSHMWHVSPTDHAALMYEVERQTRLLVHSLDDVETAEASFSIWRVRWNGGA